MRRIAIVALALAAGLSAARAYTADERTFCEPEARRLCSAIDLVKAGAGFYGGIIACFKSRRRELSARCVDAIKRAQGK